MDHEQRTDQKDTHLDGKPGKDADDKSLTGKAREKVEELAHPPKAAEYDSMKTNPVTGQRRTP